MAKNRELQLVKKFEDYIDNNDKDSIVIELPKLLKSFLKLSSRMDRILKQSDRQQMEVLKLSQKLEVTNSHIENLLNNAGQGFLYFDEDMVIGSEYSKEAGRIFEKELNGESIADLLYEDESKREFFKTTLRGILGEPSIRQEILISLLQKEFEINQSFIEIEYKVLDKEHFMAILTDITDKKELEEKVRQEQQILKMVVEVVSSIEQFLEIKRDYEDLISNIQNYKTFEKLKELRMQIHTYKGLFAQKEMLNIVKRLHGFEDEIDKSISQSSLTQTLKQITSQEMKGWIEHDMSILKEILGDDIF